MSMVDITSPAFEEAVAEIVEAKTYNWIGDINIEFVLASGYLVFIMQLGFALLTIGAVRAKSAKSVALKNVMDVCAGGIGYYIFGWAFAYGDSERCCPAGNPFIGSQMFALSGMPSTSYSTFYFQFVFAISTATIVSGAVAERVRFMAYGMYALFLTAWVYPVLSHWVWSPTGWASTTRADGPLLFGSGAYDTVGSGAVHMVGGVAGLAGAIVAGPRIGRFTADGKPVDMPGHNTIFYMMGVLLLWLGFYGFNPGTMGQIIATDGTDFAIVVARCAISTTMGACFGGCTALVVSLIYYRIKEGKIIWDLGPCCNGALTGMVVITSGCATYEPWAAAIGGIIGGLVVVPGGWFMLHVCKVDDPVDAFTVHGMGGALGVWWYSLAAKEGFVHELYGATNPDGVTPRHYGWWMGDDATILGANTVWILVIFGWTMGMMLPFFYGLKLCGWLRVSAEEELAGVDVSKHGGHAYPGMEKVYDLEVATNGMGDTLPSHKMRDSDDSNKGAPNDLQLRVRDLEAQLKQVLAHQSNSTEQTPLNTTVV
uniref:Ammonium transporter n=1 Tax=Asterochloris sp. Armaleo 7/29/2003 TaxID=1050235 RepID=I1T0D8_9CHLO|nr:ammonium transporter 1.2 [Asterochloris sp. Armaleo 7/29/2003]